MKFYLKRSVIGNETSRIVHIFWNMIIFFGFPYILLSQIHVFNDVHVFHTNLGLAHHHSWQVVCFQLAFNLKHEASRKCDIGYEIDGFYCTIWVNAPIPDMGALCIEILRPRRNEQNFADDIFKHIFFDENVWISIKISLKGLINNIPALVQIMARHRSGDRPLSEPMVVSLSTASMS